MKKDAFLLPFYSPGSRRLALPKKGQAENPLEEQVQSMLRSETQRTLYHLPLYPQWSALP
ncbi:hypothetical protein F2Q69_00009511 [Brassica cretica]|uniref:Uncharacterized protein n=1 Tax=Brassica cretica TaxID=69181 RepID=A0A8S9PIX4_BRACR|nr:hypothetical protein F2Q69_00009511 [Brassica cretica]